MQAVDVAVAVGAGAFGVAVDATRRAGSMVRPVAGMVLRPPWLPERWQAERWAEPRLAALAEDGRARRAALASEVSRVLDLLVPPVVEQLLRRVELTDLVLRHVDVDRVVAAADLDLAATRLDLSPIIDRIDLVGLANEIIDEVDLPEIIRESTGSMASDTVREVRMQGIAADEAVARTVDRLLFRRARPSTPVPAVHHQPEHQPEQPAEHEHELEPDREPTPR